MKSFTFISVVALFLLIGWAGFNTTEAGAGCSGGGGSHGCGSTQSTKATAPPKELSMSDQCLAIAESVDSLESHFVDLMNIADRNELQDAMKDYLKEIGSLQRLVADHQKTCQGEMAEVGSADHSGHGGH